MYTFLSFNTSAKFWDISNYYVARINFKLSEGSRNTSVHKMSALICQCKSCWRITSTEEWIFDNRLACNYYNRNLIFKSCQVLLSVLTQTLLNLPRPFYNGNMNVSFVHTLYFVKRSIKIFLKEINIIIIQKALIKV